MKPAYTTLRGANDASCLPRPANDTQIGLVLPPSVQSIRDVPAVAMPLYGVAKSLAARELVHNLTLYLTEGRRLHGSDRLPLGVAAAIYDLLHAASYMPPRACYRPMRTRDFTGKRITYTTAKRAFDLLATSGFITRHVGRSEKRGWGENTVTRLLPTEALLRYAAAFGIVPANREDHFARHIDAIPLNQTVKLNAGSMWRAKGKIKGKPLPVDFTDPPVLQMAHRIAAINEYAAAQRIEGAEFFGFYRGFNLGDDLGHGYQKGGRLYAFGGVFQQMARDDRKSIYINGDPTVEIDIGSSHLSIFLAHAGVTFDPQTDLYYVPGVDRRVVKAYVNLAVSLPRLPKAWPSEMVSDFLADENSALDLSLYPIATVRDICLELHPVLRRRKDFAITWADLQFIESCIVIDSVELLAKRSITALPIHDSLIVPSKFKEEAVLVLKERFQAYSGVEPRIKIER